MNEALSKAIEALEAADKAIEEHFEQGAPTAYWRDVQAQAREALSALSALQEARPVAWISVDERLPDVPVDGCREFIIACNRGHNGKTYVFAAHYLNAKLLMTDDEDCPEDGKPFTGWYQERADDEYDTAWHKVCQPGDVVTHWMALPAAPDAAHPQPAQQDARDAEGFYLASFKRPFNDGFVTWWGPNNAGYTPYLSQAGIYTAEEIEAGYHDSEYTVPVPVSFVRQFEQRVVDYGMSVCGETFWSASNLRAALAAAKEQQ